MAPATGTYYALVTGQPGTNYSLVVTRDGAIDTEPNDGIATAQDLGANTQVLGAVQKDVRTLVNSYSGGLYNNEGLVVDHGTLYVASTGNNRILRYDVTTAVSKTCSRQTTGWPARSGLFLGPMATSMSPTPVAATCSGLIRRRAFARGVRDGGQWRTFEPRASHLRP